MWTGRNRGLKSFSHWTDRNRGLFSLLRGWGTTAFLGCDLGVTPSFFTWPSCNLGPELGWNSNLAGGRGFTLGIREAGVPLPCSEWESGWTGGIPLPCSGMDWAESGVCTLPCSGWEPGCCGWVSLPCSEAGLCGSGKSAGGPWELKAMKFPGYSAFTGMGGKNGVS